MRRSRRYVAVLFAAVAVVATACNPPMPPAEGVACSVGVVGDSLAVGTATYLGGELGARGCGITFSDARTGRPTSEGARQLGVQLRARPDTQIVVVSLGTNNYSRPGGFPRLIDQVMTAAAGRRVVWMNISGNIPTKREMNQHLWDATDRWGNLWVVDWSAQVEMNPTWLARDGIHQTSAGYRGRAAVTANFLRNG